MSTDEILVERRDHVAIVTLNRPQVMNAMTRSMFNRLQELCEELNDDQEVRSIVWTGAGRGFCSGVDLSGRDFSSGEDRTPMLYAGLGSQGSIHGIRKPTIAAVNGPAVGVGFAMALACDMRIMAEGTRVLPTFSHIGLPALDGVGWMLPRIVGEAKALELLYAGEFVDSEEALRIGLVSYVTPPDKIMDKALELAAKFASGPPFANYLSKFLVRQSAGLTYQQYLPHEYSASLNNRYFAAHDIQESAAARSEKRPPQFKGVPLARRE